MELRHEERPRIFPSQLASIYGWVGYQQLSPTIQHINLLIYPTNISKFGLLVLASGLIADYQHQLDNYLMALQAIDIAATLFSTWFNKAHTSYLLR